jgi:hypothetical protein
MKQRLVEAHNLEPKREPEISVFLPVYNEQDSIDQLHLKLTEALTAL